MTPFEKQLHSATKNIRLSDADRARLREHLVTYMEYQPIRKKQKQAVQSTSRSLPVFSFFRAHHISGALMIALLTSSFGMTFAAADALPGDLLYGVKVDVNEELVGAFITDTEKKIAWERERAERRLDEASQLAAEGRLDSDRKEEVTRRFAQHTDSVVQRVLAVEQSDPVLAAEVSTEFEEALETHGVVLARLLVNQDSEASDEDKAFVGQVGTAAQRVSQIADDAEEKIALAVEESETNTNTATTGDAVATGSAEEMEGDQDTEAQGVESANMRVRAAYRMQERAQEHLARAQEEVTKLDDQSEVRVHAMVQIDQATVAIEEGSKALEDGDHQKAYGAFRKAAATLQRVSQLLEATALFNVSILEGGIDIPDTDKGNAEERAGGTSVEDLHVLRDDTKAAIDNVKSLLLAQENLGPVEAERANSFLKDAMAHLLRAEIAMVLGQDGKARALFTEALRLSANAEAMLQPLKVEEKNPTTPISVPEVSGGNAAPPPVPDLPRLDVVTVYHEYEDGVHTYSGVFYTPTPCFQLRAESLVAESFPEQVTLQLNTKEDVAKNCPMVIDRKAFSVTATASAEALLKGVTVNGVTNSFEVVEGPNTELFSDPVMMPVERKETGQSSVGMENTTNPPAPENTNIIERTLNATSKLLH